MHFTRHFLDVFFSTGPSSVYSRCVSLLLRMKDIVIGFYIYTVILFIAIFMKNTAFYMVGFACGPNG